MMKLARSLFLTAALGACAAHAENAKPAPKRPATPAPAIAEKPAAPAPAQGSPAQGSAAQGSVAPAAAAPAMSESKFLGALYAAIARKTPAESPAGEGEVTASFHVNGQGKIDKVTIDKTTSPALAEAVKKILATVEAPPPPGGSMDVGQTFMFRGTPK